VLLQALLLVLLLPLLGLLLRARRRLEQQSSRAQCKPPAAWQLQAQRLEQLQGQQRHWRPSWQTLLLLLGPAAALGARLVLPPLLPMLHGGAQRKRSGLKRWPSYLSQVRGTHWLPIHWVSDGLQCLGSSVSMF
jgi:hypothetical protein